MTTEMMKSHTMMSAGGSEMKMPMANGSMGEMGMMQLMGRVAIFIYGMAAYAGFLATFLYAMGFVGNWLVPKSIDSGTVGPMLPSLAINAMLLCVFVIQHTIMARPFFKRMVTRWMPMAMERSTFVLATVGCFALLFWQWRPLPMVMWHVEDPMMRAMMITISLMGWMIVLASSFMVSHFDLFGVRQVILNLLGQAYRPMAFRVVGLYRWVRHPLMTGFLIAFWATPTMSVGHLFFAVMVTGYIMMGTWIEERDLVEYFGDRYRQYQRSVPSFLPMPHRMQAASRMRMDAEA